MIRAELERQARFYEDNGLNAAMMWYVIEHGESHEPHPLPTDIERGRLKDCFKNAAHLALERPDLEYVEGFATSLMMTHHAWCVTAEGVVVDPTWCERNGECGFCLGEGTVEDEIDDDDWCGEESQPCTMCDGSGRVDHKSSIGTEYFGVRIPRQRLLETLVRREVYGILDDPQLYAAASS